MWSDSGSVINFIKNEHTRFSIHILHRTNEMRNFTKSADWRHIPGELNVADFATKYTEFSKLTSTVHVFGITVQIFYMKEII